MTLMPILAAILGFECTYTTFKSDNSTASPENPILVLDNSEKQWDEDILWFIH